MLMPRLHRRNAATCIRQVSSTDASEFMSHPQQEVRPSRNVRRHPRSADMIHPVTDDSSPDTPAHRRRRPSCLSRGAIPTPAQTCFSLPCRVRARQRTPAPYKGTPGVACGTVDVAEPARLIGRRSGGWGRAELAIHSMAGGGPRAAPTVRRRCSLTNGGGCAAAVLNQWRRLRRSEYWGTAGAIPAWANAGQMSTVYALFLGRGRRAA